MSWWKKALYDTCSIITLDKLLLERGSLVRYFPKRIAALELAFMADQLRPTTAKRMKKRFMACPLPPAPDLATIFASAKLSAALTQVDKLVYATAVHRQLAVVTADKRLAKAVKGHGLQVGNMAIVLRELVGARKLTESGCEKLLLGLVARKDFLLGTPTPSWSELRNFSFPD